MQSARATLYGRRRPGGWARSGRPQVANAPQQLLPQLPRRAVAHVVLLSLALLVAFGRERLAAIDLRPSGSFTEQQQEVVQFERKPVQMLTVSRVGGAQQRRASVLQNPAFAELHQVGQGETLASIADGHDVSVAALLSANHLPVDQALQIGQELYIPSISGVLYTIQAGDTLDTIAAAHSVALSAIVGYTPNKITAGDPLPVGSEIFIPGGYRADLARALNSDSSMATTPAIPTGAVVGEVLLRQGPGDLYDVQGALTPGTPLRLLSRHNSWLEVSAGDVSGWLPEAAVDTLPEAIEAVAMRAEIPEFVPRAEIVSDKTNMRSGPGVFYDSISKLPSNERVQLVSRYNGWYNVLTADGQSGWVSADVVSVRPEVEQVVQAFTELETIEAVGMITSDQANLRRGPGTNYERLEQFSWGARVTLLGSYNSWLKVRSPDGVEGWVAAELVQSSGEILAALPETTDFPPPPPTWVWPTGGTITSYYGWRGYPWPMFHNGLDIAGWQGTPIVAARSGTVTEAGWCSGYGFCVKIAHDNGFSTIYGHLMTRPLVWAGEEVAGGQLIGYMGNTYDAAGGGYSTGVHLHFTVNRYGSPVDPLGYLP